MMSGKRPILAGAAVVLGLCGWYFWPEHRAERPRTPAVLSSIVDLREWRFNHTLVDGETKLQLTASDNFQCAGAFHANPKEWSNVSQAIRPPGPNGYSQPSLHIVCKFVVANGDGVKTAGYISLNHRRSDRGDCTFRGSGRVPAVPGEYEVQLLLGAEPPETPCWDHLPYEWHVLARCAAEVNDLP